MHHCDWLRSVGISSVLKRIELFCIISYYKIVKRLSVGPEDLRLVEWRGGPEPDSQDLQQEGKKGPKVKTQKFSL